MRFLLIISLTYLLLPAYSQAVYSGGINDGFASHTLGKSPFNLYQGGSNDGYAYHQLNFADGINFFKGGTNDGFAQHGLNHPNDFNIYKGGVQDGFAVDGRTFNTTFSIYRGGLNDGFSYAFKNSNSNYNFYKGGVADGFAYHGSNDVNHTYCPLPTTLQHISNTSSSVSLSWVPGSGNTVYQVMLIKNGTVDSFFASGSITAGPMAVSLSCLPTGSFFTYYVRESCADNAWSEWAGGFTCYTSTGCQTPTNQTASIVNTQNANLSWESNYGTQVDKPYQISYGIGINNANQGTKTAITTITPAQVNGNIRTHALYLAGGVGNITWYVREICSECDTTVWLGPNTLPANSCNVPLSTGMSVSNLTTTGATLNFTSSNYNSASKIELLNYSNSTSVFYDVFNSPSYVRQQILSGLTPNTQYGWRVKEYCSANDSTAYTAYQNFTTPVNSGGNCAAPTNQGIYVATGPMLIVKWLSPLYGNTSKGYQVAGGMNIGSPAQATIVQSNPYYISQTPQHPTHSFYGGNTPGFTWYVRDICNPGDTSVWLGPYIVGASKTDGSETTAITEDEEQNSSATLVVYPNPNADGRLFIKAMDISDNTTLLIYTAQGQLALQTTIVNKTVDVSALSNGVYMLRIETPAYNTQLKKLVIQH